MVTILHVGSFYSFFLKELFIFGHRAYTDISNPLKVNMRIKLLKDFIRFGIFFDLSNFYENYIFLFRLTSNGIEQGGESEVAATRHDNETQTMRRRTVQKYIFAIFNLLLFVSNLEHGSEE